MLAGAWKALAATRLIQSSLSSHTIHHYLLLSLSSSSVSSASAAARSDAAHTMVAMLADPLSQLSIHSRPMTRRRPLDMAWLFNVRVRVHVVNFAQVNWLSEKSPSYNYGMGKYSGSSFLSS